MASQLIKSLALPSTVARRRHVRRQRRSQVTEVTPALAWYGLFMVLPLLAMIVLSFFSWNSLVAQPHFGGLTNYRYLFQDEILRTAIVNTVLYVGVGLLLIIPGGFLLGFFLSRRPPGHAVLSVILFTPWIVSASARAMMFTGLYQPSGAINSILGAVGLGGLQHLWLSNPSTALWSVIATEAWAGIGATGVIFSAALGRIAPETYEAARLDGAGVWREMFSIAYPMTKDFVGLMTMLQFLWLFLGSAGTVLLLTNGGPGSSTMTLAFYLYDQAFVSGRIGYSQAIGVVGLLVGLIGMGVIRFAFRTEE
ncbi:carbohydrate ABC transporter permease [Microbacterium arborescens]|uniref:carbohydrate ABC transporter permease n=1 Tax=Microbacterium arborescens TaxID=33883 RepID=UPI0027860AAD|nr:sugar ABC transporter permease [Microbacterium arborescens]MDQ1218131.1 multiple sugar transport system permease protein [Microbacterium arborescens]